MASIKVRICRTFRNLFWTVIAVFVMTANTEAKLNYHLLEQARGSASFGKDAEAFAAAILFSTLKTPGRVWLPGMFQPYIDGGMIFFQGNDGRLKNYTSNGSAPGAFFSTNLRGGTGLPFGFQIEGGISQVMTSHRHSALFLGVAYQLFDFGEILITDIVPSVSLSATGLTVMMDPKLYAIVVQPILGVYHKATGIQAGYFFQYSYAAITALSSPVHKSFYRHGVTMHAPLYKGIFAGLEFAFPPLGGSMNVGYQF